MPKTTRTEARRHNVSLRVTPTVYAKLEESLATSGRSMSQELEWRVEQSFAIPELRMMLREELSALR